MFNAYLQAPSGGGPMLKGYSHSPSGAGTAFKPYLQSPLHAFGLQAKARPQDDTCGVWMNEVPLLGYLVVRGDAQDAAFNAAVQDVLGVAPPTQPSSFIRTPHGVLLWQAPDEWLLVCARAQLANCLARLQAASDGLHAQMVDNSGGLTQVYLSGTKQLAVLHHVGVYDFSTITEGRAVGTVCGKANMLVYRIDAHGVFVIFRRSFADYVWPLLRQAARPYGLGISELEHDAGHPVLGLL
ncbi:sarcosine oxidase subunit gamma [Undibacterium arcticum]|uniref:Sarcosine oxidase subunit gamma n=1 Tax=Undibacterium arcticum TaxID=1762892 RepID=A0ABV7F8F1_9BURK